MFMGSLSVQTLGGLSSGRNTSSAKDWVAHTRSMGCVGVGVDMVCDLVFNFLGEMRRGRYTVSINSI